jgi:hypothetical protein
MITKEQNQAVRDSAYESLHDLIERANEGCVGETEFRTRLESLIMSSPMEREELTYLVAYSVATGIRYLSERNALRRTED